MNLHRLLFFLSFLPPLSYRRCLTPSPPSLYQACPLFLHSHSLSPRNGTSHTFPSIPAPPLASPDSLWTCPYTPKTSSSLLPSLPLLTTLQPAPASSFVPAPLLSPTPRSLPLFPVDTNSLALPFPTSPHITTTAKIYKQLLPLFLPFSDIYSPLLSPLGPYIGPLLGPLLALSLPAPALIQRWKGNGPLSIHRLRWVSAFL